MSGEIKHVISDIVTSPKVGVIAAAWGLTIKYITDYVNPVIAELMPLCSIILLFILMRLHIVNRRKAVLEVKKLEAEVVKLEAEANANLPVMLNPSQHI
jgi:hypothetical protein